MRKILISIILILPMFDCVAQDNTIAGKVVTSYSTLHNISIDWLIQGDNNLNGVVNVLFREKGKIKWNKGMLLRRIPAGENRADLNLDRKRDDYKGFKWENKHSGSIFNLKAGTAYEIQLNLTDADGGSQTKTIEAYTRPNPEIKISDSIIDFLPGNYDTLFTQSGSEQKKLVYRCTSGNAYFSHISMRDKQWVVLEGLNISNKTANSIGIDFSGARNCVIRYCSVTAEYGIVAYLPGGTNCLISDNTVTGFYAWNPKLMGAGGATSGEGIQITGPGNIICYNTVKGFRDCISLMEDEHANFQTSIDIYNNEISGGLDDGIEADFCAGNCRIYNNRITNCFVGLSSQPSLGGPTYFIRNAMYNIVHSGFKLKRHSIGDVVLHNTLVKVGVGFGGNDTMDFAYFRNNLAIGGPADETIGKYGTGLALAADIIEPGGHSDFDYDAVGIYATKYQARIGTKKFRDVEKHGVENILMNNTFQDVRYPTDCTAFYEPTYMTLRKSSELIDGGTIIPNINDDYKGKAPDIGAYEHGMNLPHYGPRKYYVVEGINLPRYENTSFVGNENLEDPKVQKLIKKYGLDTVVRNETDELKRILLLRDWIRKKISIDNEGPFPGDGSAESILDEAIKGHGFHCAHYSLVQQAIMNAFGYVTRFVRADDGGVENGEGHHAINEIWLNSYGKWFMSDAKYNYHFEKNGIPLSCIEIHNEYLKNGAEDIVMARGSNRELVKYYPQMNRSSKEFARIFSWISWSKANNEYTGWPLKTSRLIVYGDKYFFSHTWMRGGKPHWAYNTPYFDTVASQKNIEWTPNVISAQCDFREDTVHIKLKSRTPNLLHYEMKISDTATWKVVNRSLSIKMGSIGSSVWFRTINKAKVSGTPYHLLIKNTLDKDTLFIEKMEQLDIPILTRDGVRLSTNIFIPAMSQKVPVLLLRTPYNKNPKGRHGEYELVNSGFAVVIQDCRGRYASEGIFDAFQDEANDGIDTREWILKQTWCNGKVITFGGSYEGATQWLPASLSTKNLTGMFASKTFADPYEVVYYGGALRMLRFCPWGWQMTKPAGSPEELPAMKIDSAYNVIPLIEFDKLIGWNTPFLKRWMQHPAKDHYWRRTSGKIFNLSKVSTYNLGGWFDSFLQGTIDNYILANKTLKGAARHRLVIGPWIHGNEDSKTGDLDFGASAAFNSDSARLCWLNEITKPNVIIKQNHYPVRLFVMGINKWRDEKEWPLKRAVLTKYYLSSERSANLLHGDGMLNTKYFGRNTVDTFTYNPLFPVPNIGNMKPVDQSAVETRNDVLVFTSDILNTDIEVTGPLHVVLYASSSASTTDFTAKLVDVFPDGRAINLREGIIRSTLRINNRKAVRIIPDKIYRYYINLWSISNVFLKGHKIRVEISSSNFPMFDRNLNTCLIPALCRTTQSARQKIYHSKKYPSHIMLPIIPQ